MFFAGVGVLTGAVISFVVSCLIASMLCASSPSRPGTFTVFPFRSGCALAPAEETRRLPADQPIRIERRDAANDAVGIGHPRWELQFRGPAAGGYGTSG